MLSQFLNLFVLQKRKLQPRESQSLALDSVNKAKNTELSQKILGGSIKTFNFWTTIVCFYH